jgi:hypothetical protein
MEDRQMKRLLQGQSALAKKVFAAVPIDEPWKFDKIHRVLHEMGKTSAHITAVHACLGQLKDAGIIREPERYFYQRPAIAVGIKVDRKKKPEPPAKPIDPVVPLSTPFKGQDIFPPAEPAVKVTQITPTIAISQTPLQESIGMAKLVQTTVKTTTPMDLVMEIAEDVKALQAETNDRFKQILKRIDDVAIQVQKDMLENAEAANKLKQLQELLK